MRYILFVFLILLFTSSVCQTYAPLGATWTFSMSEFFWGTYPVKWKVKRDTAIMGKICSVIEKSYSKGAGFKKGGPGEGDIANEIVIYQDSGVVFWYEEVGQAYDTFIDYNADSGDFWFSKYGSCRYKVTVDSTDSIQFNGQKLKRMYVHFLDSVKPSYVIVENIGYLMTNDSIYGNFPRNLGLYPGYALRFFCDGYETFDTPKYSGLRCYEDSILGFVDFNSAVGDCNWIWEIPIGFEETTEGSALIFFPNPTEEKLLFSDNLINCEIEIFSQTGKRLIHLENFCESEISVSDLNPGIYFIRITEKGKVKQARFIKN